MHLELHSYFINEGRETIEVEFTIVEDDKETTKNLEILIEELEEVCDLFEELRWYDEEGDDYDTHVINRTINQSGLTEGLYISVYISEKLALLLLKPRDEAFAMLLDITDISCEAALKPDLTIDSIIFPLKIFNTKIMPIVVSL